MQNYIPNPFPAPLRRDNFPSPLPTHYEFLHLNEQVKEELLIRKFH